MPLDEQRMSKQRDVLPQVLDFVRQHAPRCPVYVGGSVSLGHERPDSDIDLLVIVPDVTEAGVPGGKVECQEEQFKLVVAPFDDVSLHLHFATLGLLRSLEEHPWRAYKFLQTEALYDPDGIVQTSKDRIAPWFEDHPDAVELWKQWLDEHRARQLSRGKQLGPLVRKFPEQVTDFWPYLDQRFGE